MSSNWPQVKLADVADIVMGQSPKGDTYNHIGEGVPLLNGPTEFGASHPTPVLWTMAPTRYCEPGDLLFCVRGSTTGRMNWADRDYCIGRGVGAFRAKTGRRDTHFIYYTFVHQLDRLLSLSAGSVFPNLSRKDFATFKMAWPDSETRSRIVKVLDSLDDKIELNRRMNETLEDMARALFKSWFVNFDPVRAKMEGRQPVGMDEETAALFPDSFEDSTLGEIPGGWRADSFSEMIELTGGGTPKTSIDEYWNGNIPWFSVVDAPRNSDAFVISTEKRITEVGVANSSTKLLPVGATIISARGTVGKCALVGVPMAMNQSCYGLRGRDDRGDYFTYFATRRMVAELRQHAHGSVFSTITRNTFHGVKVAIPPPDLTRKYDEVVSPRMHLILANLHQSRTLAALRDTLLPKLSSGEVRAAEAEKIVEETV